MTLRSFASLLAAVVLSACGGSDCTESNAAGTSSIALQGNRFVPACIKASPGGTLTFTNMDATEHRVASGGFDSGPIAAGAHYDRAFLSAGTFELRCPIHSETATVIVR